jgi:hypothetical protein
VNYVVGKVRGGIYVLLNEMIDNNNLNYSLNGEGLKIPFNVFDTEAVKKVLDRVLSKFSLRGVGDNDPNHLVRVYRDNKDDILNKEYEIITKRGTF